MKRHMVKDTFVRSGRIALESYDTMGSGSLEDLAAYGKAVKEDAREFANALAFEGIASIPEKVIFSALPNGFVKISCRVMVYLPGQYSIPDHIAKKVGISNR